MTAGDGATIALARGVGEQALCESGLADLARSRDERHLAVFERILDGDGDVPNVSIFPYDWEKVATIFE